MLSKPIYRQIAVCLLFWVVAGVAHAVEVQTSIQEADIKPYKRTDASLYLTPSEAYALKKDHPKDVLFVDVRTHAEVAYVGSPTVMDVNIPLYEIKPDSWNAKYREYDMQRNADFEAQLKQAMDERGLNPDSPIIFMCRSGARSAGAADIAAKLGFTRAYSLVEGFEGDSAKDGPQKGQRVVNGWKNAGLPWQY